MKRKEKRGAAHIEIILSFVLFISFLLFIFMFINPTKRTEPSRVLLDIAEQGIEKSSSINVTSMVLKIEQSISENCFTIDLAEINISNIVGNKKAAVKDADDEVINSKKSGSILQIQKSRDFYKIFLSEDFKETSSSLVNCKDLDEENLTLGQTKTTKIISFKKLAELKLNYETGYENLKESFDFPTGNDFGFMIKDTKGNTILNVLKEKPAGISVIAREKPVQMVYENATFVSAMLNTQAW